MKKFTARQIEETRRRGAEIARNPDNIKDTSRTGWKVRSQSVAGLPYAVAPAAAGIACGCARSSNGGRALCKHVEAVMIRIGRTWHRTGGRAARMPTGRVPAARRTMWSGTAAAARP